MAKLHPRFNSFNGLKCLIFDMASLTKGLCASLEEMSSTSEDSDDKRYEEVNILHSFLANVPEPFLEQCLKFAAKARNLPSKTRLLYLDPLSEIGIIRAKDLDINPIEKVNESLWTVNNCVRRAIGKQIKGLSTFNKNRKSEKFLEKQLSEISKDGKALNLEVKFYRILTDAPAYIVGNYLFKGFFLHQRLDEANPWLQFAEDPSQEDDVYDTLYNNFSNVWESANSQPTLFKNSKSETPMNNKIFVSYGHHQAAKDFISATVLKSKSEPVIYEDDFDTGKTVIENLEDLTSKCSAAIIILTKDDEASDGGERARQNVIHELGYCQAKYGRTRVLLFAEEGVDIPSNLAGVQRINFPSDDIKRSQAALRDQFLKKL